MSEKIGKYPMIAVLGLDPEKHEMPPLLKHHISKMAKDFPVIFWSKEDMNSDTWKDIQDLVDKTNFVPQDKDKPKSNIIISSKI